MVLCYARGNDAAVALAEYVAGGIPEFAELMNKKAEELGLENTHFVTPHGLDEDEHYTTAYELAKIADYALNIEEIAEIVKTKNYTVTINGYSKAITNTNELLGNLEGVYGVKTGFTNGANRCLVTATKRDNMDIICIVLGADTKKDRTKDSVKLIEYAFSNYQMVDIKDMIEREFNTLVKNTNFNVYKGIDNEVKIDFEKRNITYYPLKKDEIKNIQVETEIKSTLLAPVEPNESIRQNICKN